MHEAGINKFGRTHKTHFNLFWFKPNLLLSYKKWPFGKLNMWILILRNG